jgi:hypothetical protein
LCRVPRGRRDAKTEPGDILLYQLLLVGRKAIFLQALPGFHTGGCFPGARAQAFAVSPCGRCLEKGRGGGQGFALTVGNPLKTMNLPLEE